jgi:Uma2 family endonuclease
MIVCGPQPERHLQQVPDLVVEVLGDSTERMDRGPKKQLYQEQGVSNYLIANPKERSLCWFELQSNSEFADRSEEVFVNTPIGIALPNGCRIEIDVAKLFGS